jgi:hypothetical protein
MGDDGSAERPFEYKKPGTYAIRTYRRIPDFDKRTMPLHVILKVSQNCKGFLDGSLDHDTQFECIHLTYLLSTYRVVVGLCPLRWGGVGEAARSEIN